MPPAPPLAAYAALLERDVVQQAGALEPALDRLDALREDGRRHAVAAHLSALADGPLPAESALADAAAFVSACWAGGRLTLAAPPPTAPSTALAWHHADRLYVGTTRMDARREHALPPTPALSAPTLRLCVSGEELGADNPRADGALRLRLAPRLPRVDPAAQTCTVWLELGPRRRDEGPQRAVTQEAVDRVLAAVSAEWREALSQPATPRGAVPALRRLLRDCTRRPAVDRFLHPRLGDRLEGALDRFVAARLQPLLDADDPAPTLARLRALRAVARDLAARLHRVEAALVELWRWPPLVRRRDRVRARKRAGGWTVACTHGLQGRPHLRRLSALAPADAPNLLVQGDAARALRLLGPRLAGRVQCAYLDPPFNTGSRSFRYRDAYTHSAWLTLMQQVVAAVRPTLTADGTLYAHIDYTEKERLKLLLDAHLHYVTEIIWRIGWISGFKSRAPKFIRNHDTIYQYGACRAPRFTKDYLPYPEGYLRRDGRPPAGRGVPIEDTWNCSAADRLHSVQILSYSKEKVGDATATQKNEALLRRMLRASSAAGEWVLDPFGGTGTTAATATKMGRRWVTVERSAAQVADNTLPRLLRVLAGDPYGVSAETGWTGGGAFDHLALATFGDLLAAADWTPPAPGPDTLGVHLDADAGRARLCAGPLEDPFALSLGAAGPPIDPMASVAHLHTLSGERLSVKADGAVVQTGTTAGGAALSLRWVAGETAGLDALVAGVCGG